MTMSATTVTTPSPIRMGMADRCPVFHLSPSGDRCWAIANEARITLDQFYEWNLAVGYDHSGVWPDYYYCVGILEGKRERKSAEIR